MKTIVSKNGNIVNIYAETFEYEAYEQIRKLVEFEAYKDSKIRIMPDAHAGKGCTVGTTICITDKVTPNLVGVDIGCGMLTVKLKDKTIDLQKLDSIIADFIPCGFNVHESKKADFDFSDLVCAKQVDLKRALLSIGSLGGGNHFIEIEQGKDGLYLVIHSGSRKLGGDVCKHYQDKAFQNANEMGKIFKEIAERLKKEGRQKDIEQEIKNVKKPSADKDLAYLQGIDFDNYMNDMQIVQRYAILNRATMANIIIKNYGLREDSRFETIHNYIDFKRMILRKGAVSAEKGETLLIPINMRDGSLLCIGKGNEDWNYSAPHGAGRLMSRSRAKQQISMQEFSDSMTDVFSSSVCADTLDEAPQAYKTIEEIKNSITDTAEIVEVLKPIYNFKAH